MKTIKSCKAEFPKPARRIAGQRQDVWTTINDAAARSMVKPVVNMGQGFFGYNPPQFIMDAAKEAVTKVDSNQYSPTTGRPSLKRAIAESYSEALQTKINPDTEVAITTGANEGMNLTVPAADSY
ncbi:putative aminotransferase [Colletotrichum siamense]|uniref:putative aminotransferase n=1 Tax=Colletotrichum siamense TaxID=690259 RepID=UPI00187256E7|nr:putative aminotransferase [Colletotrichum siamense]KAF5497430.1 putative aminotransferase [Colletotrichum siamense]